jgi:hypothetical protein
MHRNGHEFGFWKHFFVSSQFFNPQLGHISALPEVWQFTVSLQIYLIHTAGNFHCLALLHSVHLQTVERPDPKDLSTFRVPAA